MEMNSAALTDAEKMHATELMRNYYQQCDRRGEKASVRGMRAALDALLVYLEERAPVRGSGDLSQDDKNKAVAIMATEYCCVQDWPIETIGKIIPPMQSAVDALLERFEIRRRG